MCVIISASLIKHPFTFVEINCFYKSLSFADPFLFQLNTVEKSGTAKSLLCFLDFVPPTNYLSFDMCGPFRLCQNILSFSSFASSPVHMSSPRLAPGFSSPSPTPVRPASWFILARSFYLFIFCPTRFVRSLSPTPPPSPTPRGASDQGATSKFSTSCTAPHSLCVFISHSALLCNCYPSPLVL